MQYISFFITDSVINNRFTLSKLRSFCKFWALLNSIQDTLNIFQTYFTRFRSTWYDSTGESYLSPGAVIPGIYDVSVDKKSTRKGKKNSLTKSRPDWCVVNCIFRLFGLLFYTFSNYKCCRGEGLSECFCSNIFGTFYLFFPFSSFSPLPWIIDVNVLIQRFFHTVQLPLQ